MSEVQTRPAASRGRGSGRGGRGGFATRGARAGGRINGDKSDHTSDANTLTAFDDEGGEIGDLKKLYGSKTGMIKEMFPDWSEVDILFALQETDGDENLTVTRIAEGTISQWGEVSKPKKAPRTKTKDSTTGAANHDASATGSRPARGGRNVSEGGRGGRGRTTERGGRGGRGRPSPTATNGTRHKENQQLSVPTEESNAWGAETNSHDAPAGSGSDALGTKDASDKPTSTTAPTSTAVEVPKPAPAKNAPKTWASMLRQSTVPKPVAKPKETSPPKPIETLEPLPPAEPVEPEPEPVAELPTEPLQESTPAELPTVIEPEIALPPSKDQLTETNLEQVYDESKPAATGTAASTTADSWDPRQNPPSAGATPLSASQQQHQPPRPSAATTSSGYVASALKATTERRTPSYQRRILDQEEAVRMPGNREVDRAAVKFGAFSLNGEDDIDGDREEPETRAQPPADSPIAHPRASLPPAPQAAPPGLDGFGSQKPAGSLPTPTAPAALTATVPQPSAAAQPEASQSAGTSAQQFSRYGQGPQEPSSFQQKSIDPFSQSNNSSSTQTQSPYDNFPTQQSQQQTQQPTGAAFSSAPNEFSTYYTADGQNRANYNYYGQQYGQQQQGGQGHQEGLPSQQRSFSGYNASQTDNLSQYPQSGGLHNPSRYGGVTSDAQNSGHTTPNPPAQAQQQASQGSQPQSHAQQNYPYNHPYYNNAYYHNYMNYGGNYGGQGGYGGAPYGKGGMYGQPYSMSPQGPYDHSSSPATGFGQSSLHRADSGLGSGLGGDFGRAGSAQSANQPGVGGSGFGGMQDTYGRGASSFQSQASQSFNSGSQPSGATTVNDDLKPFGDAKTGAGPSPSIGGARPGSAANNVPSSQAGLPPPQSSSQMGGYGGYPTHGQGHGLHGSSGYGMGGASSGQHGNTPFGSYGQGQGYGGGGYYGSGGQQQQQQQQRGWGGNYH